MAVRETLLTEPSRKPDAEHDERGAGGRRRAAPRGA